jgi:hypothetical protein
MSLHISKAVISGSTGARLNDIFTVKTLGVEPYKFWIMWLEVQFVKSLVKSAPQYEEWRVACRSTQSCSQTSS